MPWWLVFVPILLLFLYGLLKANFEAFREIEQERDEFKAELKELEEGLEAGVNPSFRTSAIVNF